MLRIEVGLPEAPIPGVAVDPDGPWPARCRTDLDHLHASLGDATYGDAPLRARLDELIAHASRDPSPVESPDLVDELLRLGAELEESGARTGSTPPLRSAHAAPPAPSPLRADALLPLPVVATAAPDELPVLDGSSLQLSFSELERERWRCTFGALHAEPLRTVRCVEAGRAHAGLLTAQRDASNAFLRTQRGRFDRFELVRPLETRESEVLPLAPGTSTAALYGDQLVTVTAHRWSVRTVTTGGKPLGSVLDLGEVVGEAPELEACRTATALVLGLKTTEGAAGTRESWRAAASYEAGVWRRTLGAARVDVGATLNCQGHAATWTWLEGGTLAQVRCNADGCAAASSGQLRLSWDAGGTLHVGDLGGEAFLVGVGATLGPVSGGSVGSVRMRVAPLAAIASAPDVVILGDKAHGGANVADLSIYSRSGAALLLLRGDDPLRFRAVRVDSLGNFAPVVASN